VPPPSDAKVVVVAGASTGVGRATAQRFAQSGCTTVLLARRKDRLDEVVEEIGPSAFPIATDIRSPDSVRAAFAEIERSLGRVDVLVNSAGITRIRLVEEASDADIIDVVGTNYLGPIYTIRSAIPLLRAAGGGDIINISSEITLDDMPLMTLYSSSKRALNGLTASLTKELRREGIRVGLVILGAVGDTSFADNFTPEDLGRALPVWEADGYLTRMSGSGFISAASVAEVVHSTVGQPRDVMLDVIHIRPAR
jgi:NAD(P)-dependent dehydrogenase (short-subunit alcohol dehydrogenase family)